VVAGRREQLRDGHLRLRREHAAVEDVRARVARIARAVAVAVGLARIGDVRAAVLGVARPVAVGVDGAGVGGAAGTAPRTRLGDVAHAGRRAADRARPRETVGRARIARARAVFSDVAG